MKYLIKKSKLNYLKYFKNEVQIVAFKLIGYNCKLPFFIRQYALTKLFKIKNTYRQRCFLTFKARSISNQFKLSRIKLRYLISNNFISGIKKVNY